MPKLTYRFSIGCRVGRVIADEPVQGIVTGFTVNGNSDPLYTVTWADGSETYHFEFELENARESWATSDKEAAE